MREKLICFAALLGMGRFDAIKFCAGATTAYCEAGAKSCLVSGNFSCAFVA